MVILIYLAKFLGVLFLVMLAVVMWNEWNLLSREGCMLKINECLANKDFATAKVHIKKHKRLQSLFIKI